jgi:predicted dehydrogenase
MSEPVLLLGLGFMGRAYAEILRELGRPIIPVGRSVQGAEEFTRANGVAARAGGLEQWLASGEPIPREAIVCVTTDHAGPAAQALMKAGVKRILLEKPGSATYAELTQLAEQARTTSSEVLVAYNRRFYASVLEAERRIAAEGGLTSFHFEFTERERDATSGKFSPTVQQHWALANSTHVIDLAFFLGGEPVRLNVEVAGQLDWHPGGAQFAGSGATASRAIFSYCANWTSGGRWGVELMTRESRLILRPLEQLQVQRRGTFVIEPVTLDVEIETRFKPGLYRQTRAFLEGIDSHRLVPIAEQARRASQIYGRMSGEVSAVGSFGDSQLR